MSTNYRTPLAIYTDALNTLESEPGPATPETTNLMHYLRQRITEYQCAERILDRLPQPGRLE